MSDAEAFLQAIAENVYDDAPRLIFADWLEEHGHVDRAEFIRVQCELEPMRDLYEIERAAELHRRENELLRKHRHEWLGDLPEWWYDAEVGVSIEFRRGVPDVLALPTRTFLSLGAEIRRVHPTIRRVVLFRVNEYGERLARCPALDGLAELELACWYSDKDARAIAASIYLSQLQILEVWLGRREEVGSQDYELCRIMATSKAWPRLRELTLLNLNRDEDARHILRYAEACKVAVYRDGYLTHFPFAADYWHLFPGYLPDGQMALAAEDYTSSPATLCVLTFDHEGKQTDKAITVPMPADLLDIRTLDWDRYKKWMRRHLTDMIGLRPAFIRIAGCEFPRDQYRYNSPHWELPDNFGIPDADDEESWSRHPCGNGGEVYRVITDGEYLLGSDRYANKRGYVYSTASYRSE